MHHIFVDFEMNHIAGEYVEERAFSKMEIVEIGAVKLDDSYQEISSFKSYANALPSTSFHNIMSPLSCQSS